MDAEELSITLPVEMAEAIRAAVSTDGYSCSDEVVREAVRLWHDQRREREQRLDVIRARLRQTADKPWRVAEDHFGRQVYARLAGVGNARTPSAALSAPVNHGAMKKKANSG